MTLVDTNVLLDIVAGDQIWLDWSAEQLSRCRQSGPVLINEIGYAEIAARIETEIQLHALLSELGVQFEQTSKQALFAAGKAFFRYRKAGGPRTSILPDFFIGAHAQVSRIPILTRDPRRYRTHFPDVELIAPQS